MFLLKEKPRTTWLKTVLNTAFFVAFEWSLRECSAVCRTIWAPNEKLPKLRAGMECCKSFHKVLLLTLFPRAVVQWICVRLISLFHHTCEGSSCTLSLWEQLWAMWFPCNFIGKLPPKWGEQPSSSSCTAECFGSSVACGWELQWQLLNSFRWFYF